MIKLSSKDVHILVDGLKYHYKHYQFNNKYNDDFIQHVLKSRKRKIIWKVRFRLLPNYCNLYWTEQLDLDYALFCSYYFFPLSKSKKYNKMDIAKLTKRLTKKSMAFNIRTTLEAKKCLD